MRTFILSVIEQAATKIGVESVMLRTSSNPTLPKPRIEAEFLPDSYVPTRRKIALRNEDGNQIIVSERYEIDSPVMLYLIDKEDTKIESLSRALVMAFPKGVADNYNNWVRIRASGSEWRGFKAPTVGQGIRIEPIIERTFSVRVGFMWRLTYEKATKLSSNFNLQLTS